MIKFKIKKIRSCKIFIFLGLIFAMFTACIFGFKSYAYTTDPNGDLVSNNLIDWTRIRQNDQNTWRINNNGYREQISFGNFNTPNLSFTIRYNPLSQYNYDLFLYCIDSSVITPGEYVFIYQFNTNIDYYRFDVSITLLGEDIYVDNSYGLYGNYCFAYGVVSDESDGDTYVLINHPAVNLPTGYVDFSINLQLFKIDSNDIGFNPLMYNGPIFYADDNPEFNYNSGYQTGFDAGYNAGVSVGSGAVSDEYNNLIGQYAGLQNDYNDALDEIDRLENANQVLQNQIAQIQNGYNLNSLMWSIGGTPFESFKQIWNVDLMGVNLSNLFLGLISALVLIWVIKHFLL